MNFAAFLILNAVIFIRPAEVFEPLVGVPIYNLSILACLAVSLPRILPQLTLKGMASRPISVCVFAMLPAVVISQIWRGNVYGAREGVDEYGRVLLYYVLLVGTVTTEGRLRSLLNWTAIFIGVIAGLCLLQYHGLADIPALQPYSEGFIDPATGEFEGDIRLQASGLFNNPNAMARILTVGILASLYAMTEPRRWPRAPFWAAMIGMLGYAEYLTMSRGGLLGLIAGIVILFVSRLGVKRAIPLAAVAMLGMLTLFGGGRQTDLSTDGGTGKQRIELWNEGFELLKPTPLFGIGINNYAEELGLGAHNSFIHSYVELGFLGGTFFTGAYCLAIATLWRLGGDRSGRLEDPGLRRLRPFLLAILGAEVIGQMSISRTYSLATYLPLGLAVAYFDLASATPEVKLPRCGVRLFGLLAMVSFVALVAFVAYVKIKVSRL